MVAISSVDVDNEMGTRPVTESAPLLVQPREKKLHDVTVPLLKYDSLVSGAMPHQHFPPSSLWWSPSWPTVAQVVIITSMVVYTTAHTIVASPLIQFPYFEAIEKWWEEPAAVDGGEPKAHFDLIKPTYFFLYCVVPFAVIILVLEAQRDHEWQRLASRRVMHMGMFLRRKPGLLLRGDHTQYPTSNTSMFSGLHSVLELNWGEIIFLTLFLGGNVFMVVTGWFMARHNQPVPGKEYTFFTTLEIIGIVFGFNCVYSMAFLFLPVTRNSAWMEFMGISYANGMKYHRWLGVWTLVTGVIHGLPFYFVWAHDGVLYEKSMPCFDCSLQYTEPGYPTWFNVFGEISLIFLLVLGIASVPWVRRRMYETFYYTHYLFIPGVIFAVLHWGPIIWWLLPSFLVYLVDRIVGSTNALSAVAVMECTVLPDEILKVVIQRDAGNPRGANFTVGQFVYLNVPAISKWQWHPFTIGSSPRADDTTFTIWLKSLGDWTEDLMQHARECEAKQDIPVMFVDGYYGSSLEMYDQYSTLCLIGGGIGATPMFAMLEDMVCRIQLHHDDDCSRWPNRKVHFVFAFREMALLEEIHPVLQELIAMDPHGDIFTYEFFLTRTPREPSMLDQKLSCYRHHQHAESVAALGAQPLSALLPKKSGCPFAEPLRSPGYRAVLYSILFVGSSYAIARVDDSGIIMQNGAATQYWPLQNLADVAVVFVIALVAYLFLLAEKLMKWMRGRTLHHVGDAQTTTKASRSKFTETSDVCTYRDLLAEYNVALGCRPDMRTILRRVHSDAQHDDPMARASALGRTVGVFISGPEALKRATDDASAEIGSIHFDIHDEEFEL